MADARNRGAILIRAAVAADRDFILSLLPHLVACPLPPGHRRNGVLTATRERIATALDALPAPHAAFFIAVRGRRRAGFVQLELQRDPFSAARACHIVNLAVTPAHEGRGIGTALLTRAETWARSRRCTLLTLNVFPGNARARALYGHVGFNADMLRMTKHTRTAR